MQPIIENPIPFLNVEYPDVLKLTVLLVFVAWLWLSSDESSCTFNISFCWSTSEGLPLLLDLFVCILVVDFFVFFRVFLFVCFCLSYQMSGATRVITIKIGTLPNSVPDYKNYPFWANLGQKLKVLHFPWKLVPIQNWRCWFQNQ